jgi:predicted nucleic acid-binding protein
LRTARCGSSGAALTAAPAITIALAAGRFTVAGLDRDDYATIIGLESRYADLHLGLADCSLVVLADRYQTNRIVTFDERHFRAVTSLHGEAFTLLPADA